MVSIEEIDEIMRAVKYLKASGGFITSFSETWFAADPDNRIVLQPVAITFIKKFRLGRILQQAKERGLLD